MTKQEAIDKYGPDVVSKAEAIFVDTYPHWSPERLWSVPMVMDYLRQAALSMMQQVWADVQADNKAAEEKKKWVIQHEFDGDPTYITRSSSNVEDAGFNDDDFDHDTDICLPACIPVEQRRQMAKRIVDKLNKPTSEDVMRINSDTKTFKLENGHEVYISYCGVGEGGNRQELLAVEVNGIEMHVAWPDNDKEHPKVSLGS